MPVLLHLPPNKVLLIQLLRYCCPCRTAAGEVLSTPITCQAWPLLTQLPLNHLWNPTVPHSSVSNFCRLLIQLPVTSINFSCYVLYFSPEHSGPLAQLQHGSQASFVCSLKNQERRFQQLSYLSLPEWSILLCTKDTVNSCSAFPDQSFPKGHS